MTPDAKQIGLGLGSNLGDPPANLREAARLLRAQGLIIRAISSIYRTAPWGGIDQPDFANACLLAKTNLSPHDLLDCVKAVEVQMGRAEERRWGPRLIDIDILFYEGVALQDKRLTLPHKEILRRSFVLAPLAEIAPAQSLGEMTAREAARAVGSAGILQIEPF